MFLEQPTMAVRGHKYHPEEMHSDTSMTAAVKRTAMGDPIDRHGDHLNIDMEISDNDDHEDTIDRRDAIDLQHMQRKVITSPISNSSKRLSLKFKHSPHWLHSIKKKNSESQIVINQDKVESNTVSTDNFPTPKSSKRLSNAFFPKRFSTSTQLQSIPLGSPADDQSITYTPAEDSKMESSIPMKSTSPIQKTFNDPKLIRNASFGSSSMSEKSTIGRSIDMFKRTTKSILFIDSTNSPSSASNNSLTDSQILTNDEDMPTMRRSISYTNADRMKFSTSEFMTTRKNSVRNEDNKQDSLSNSLSLPKRQSRTLTFNPSLKMELNNLRSENKSVVNTNHQLFATTSRKRSKTMDGSENNPIDELTSSANSGILSSISHFVKINKSNQVTQTQTPLIPSKRKQLKLNFPKTSEDESPAQYLDRIIKEFTLPHVGEILSLEDNDFMKQALQHYLRKYYHFNGEPLDISLRKFLMLNYLPKETQQIDRLIYQFAQHYQTCHPELGLDHDTIYILTYSLIMAHTDKFNPNNKRKMTRFEFIQNVLSAIESNDNKRDDDGDDDDVLDGSKVEHLKEILGYLFDNITYCPLIKISEEQSETAMISLESEDLPLPYPLQSFLNNGLSSRNGDDYRKSSISSTLSVSASTNNSQLILQMPPPSRKKSSSFLWSGGPTLIDPYEFIVKGSKDSLADIKLINQDSSFKLSCVNPFLSATKLRSVKHLIDVSDDEPPSLKMIEEQLDSYLNDVDNEIDSSMLQFVWSSLTNSKVDFTLKIEKSKASFMEKSLVEIVELNESNNEEEYYLTRVIKVGIIEKQEMSLNKNLTLTSAPVPKPDITDLPVKKVDISQTNERGKSTNKIWKPYFCILTTLGIFFYENVALFRMRYCGSNAETGSNMVIIEEASSSKDNNNVNRSLSPDSGESAGILSFPYFRASKNEREREKYEKDGDKIEQNNMTPSFIISADCFAGRKVQNLEYDEVVNKLSASSPDLKNGKVPSNVNSESCPDIPECERSNESNKLKVNAQNLNYTFFIYGKDSKNIFMVSNLQELKSWIHSINIVSTFSNLKIPAKTINPKFIPKDWKQMLLLNHEEPRYYEVIPKRQNSMKRKQFSSNLQSYEGNDEVPFKRRFRSKTCARDDSPITDGDLGELTLERISIDGNISLNTEDHDDENSKVISDYHTAVGDTTQSSDSGFVENAFEKLNIREDALCINSGKKSLDESSVNSLATDASYDTDTPINGKHSCKKLLDSLFGVKQLLNTAPLDKKSKDELISAAKILGIKLEWLWYEQCKERTFERILQRVKDLSE